MIIFMSETESARQSLYSELVNVLGNENAQTLMTYLPPNTGDETATKTDIARLDNRFDRMDDRFDRMEDRFDRMEDRLDRFEDRLEERFIRIEDRFLQFDERFDRVGERMLEQQRFYVGVTVGTMTALTAIFSVVVGIIV